MGYDAKGRFRVRNLLNNGWIDVAAVDVMIRDPLNETWIPLRNDEFAVRNQTNTGWIYIDGVSDDLDDPCALLESIGSCNGSVGSKVMGSGNGTGSGGAPWSQTEGYPVGYDLPDAGYGGFYLIRNESWPCGQALVRGGARTQETYDPWPCAADHGMGTFSNPALPCTSVSGRGAAITEFYYVLGDQQGAYEILFAAYTGISIDVYYLGQRVASTCGQVQGRGRLGFQYVPDDRDSRCMIRVRGPELALWSLQLTGLRSGIEADAVIGIADYKGYDIQGHPDILVPRYLGTPLFPAPCHASAYVLADRVSSAGHFEYYHHVGQVGGTMYLDFKSWNNKDFVEVYYCGRRIATTLDPQTNRGYLVFQYNPVSGCEDIMVRIVAEGKGVGEHDSVYYALWCPDSRGSRELRHPCGSYDVVSAGHPTTEDCFTIDGHEHVLCGALVRLHAGSQRTLFKLWSDTDVLLDSMQLDIAATGTLETWLPVGVSRKFYVQAQSGIGCDWRIFVECAAPHPDIELPATLVPYKCIEVVPPETKPAPPDAPAFDEFDGQWTLIAHEPNGVQQLNYGWKDGYEYTVVMLDPHGHTEIASRPVFINLSMGGGPSIWCEAGPDSRCEFFRTSWGDQSTGYLRAREGSICMLFERPYRIVDTLAECVADKNYWHTVVHGGGNTVNGCPWEAGYEYIVFTADPYSVPEQNVFHIIVPSDPVPSWGLGQRRYYTGGGSTGPTSSDPRSTLMYCWMNSTDLFFDADLIWAQEDGFNGGRSAKCLVLGVLRRPLHAGSALVNWRHDYKGEPNGHVLGYEWEFGREYMIHTKVTHGCLSAYRIPTHKLFKNSGWKWTDSDDGNVGIAQQSVGWVELSTDRTNIDAGHFIHVNSLAQGVHRVWSRPFKVRGY